jgi:WD40 repeat protein
MILNDIMSNRSSNFQSPIKHARKTFAKTFSCPDNGAKKRWTEGIDLYEPQFKINFMHITPDDTWLFLLIKKVSDEMSDKSESYICAYDLCKGNKHPPRVKWNQTSDAFTGVYTCKNPDDPKEIFLFTVCEKGTIRRYSLPSFDLVREYKDLHKDYVLRILGNGEYVITGGSRGTLTAIEIKTGNVICQSKKVTSHA